MGTLALSLSGIPAATFSIATGSKSGVTVKTGQSALMRMFFFPYSMAAVLVIPTTACLLAE